MAEAKNMVYLALQNNEDAEINHFPAMVKIDAKGKLVVNKATVEEKIGREWDPQEIHVSLISLSGNVVEEDDSFAVVRDN